MCMQHLHEFECARLSSAKDHYIHCLFLMFVEVHCLFLGLRKAFLHSPTQPHLGQLLDTVKLIHVESIFNFYVLFFSPWPG